MVTVILLLHPDFFLQKVSNNHETLHMGAHLGGDAIRFWLPKYSYEVAYSSVIAIRHSVTPSVLLSFRIFCYHDRAKVFEPQPCNFTQRCTPKRRLVLIRFWAPGGTTFSFKMAAKILCWPYLRD